MFDELKSSRGDPLGTREGALVRNYRVGELIQRPLTVHGDAVGRLGVLQVRIDRRHVVLEARSVHEVGALGVFEESGFH